MPPLFTVRPLFSPFSKNPLFRFPFSSPLLSNPSNPSLTVICYSDRRRRRGGGGGARRGGGGGGVVRRGGSGGAISQKRGLCTPRDMKASEGVAFNKRRAEGNSKHDRPAKTYELKNRKLNPVNTLSYVQILGTGMDTQDTSPSVLLFFDKQRFIFNAGEGLQRFCTEHKIKLSKIDHMFMTRVCSETAGGLPGLLLTLAGITEEGMSVNMWGPSDLKYLVDAMRSFIPNAAMVHTHSFGLSENCDGATLSSFEPGKLIDASVLIDDEVVRISAISLRPHYSRDLGGAIDGSDNSNFTSICREERNNRLSDPLLPYSHNTTGLTLKPGDIAVIYACELPEIRGKFDPSKAVSLGLRPGPKYRELQLGNSVMSDDRSIMVQPSDVLGPSYPGPVVLIVDCPTPLHMLELFSTQSLNCYYADSVNHLVESIKAVSCIIHLGPASVTKNADYQKWMKKFGSTQHIMAGHEIKNMEIPTLKSSARISSRLNYLCPQLFPAPGFWSVPHINNFPLKPNGSCEFQDLSPSICQSISAENLLKFNLRPYSQLGLDRSVIPSVCNHKGIVDQLIAEIPEIVGVAKQVSQLWQSPVEGKLMQRDNMVEEPWLKETSCIPRGTLVTETLTEEVIHDCSKPPCLENITREDMEIVLLGTGSSQPSKYRNVSAIFINLFSKGSLLLDCGEGTLAQLKRRFGVEGADHAVKGLSCIWISHIHADHHTGIARILALRSRLLEGVPHEPLIVIGPRPLKRFLDAYNRLEDLDMHFLDCRHTTEPDLFSRDSSEDCSAAAASETSLFAQGSRMRSHWKRPGSPVDTATAVPVLMRLKEVLCEAGLEALYSVPVIHCPQAFGVVLKASERMNTAGIAIPGWKLVYSGDTRPCQSLIDASRDATVLIHEATFEDDLEAEAVARNHSTTVEAINVGASAGAYRTILTHFSQRYPKIPVFDEDHMDRTCIAFDLMSVNVADLPVLPKVLPFLKVLFKNEMAVDESDALL